MIAAVLQPVEGAMTGRTSVSDIEAMATLDAVERFWFTTSARARPPTTTPRCAKRGWSPSSPSRRHPAIASRAWTVPEDHR